MTNKIINNFDIDLSDIAAKGGFREFNINGDIDAGFKLEVKNSSGEYYNFTTRAFQVAPTRLSGKGNIYNNGVLFPSNTSIVQYDIYLWADPGVKHASHNEVRFEDGSVDINSSTGSNSLLLQKVIYQYPDLALTLSTNSPRGTVEVGSQVNGGLTVSRGVTSKKTPFEISCSVTTAAKSYHIIRQPTSNDVISFVEPVIGSAPIDLPGENIYPTATAAFTGDDVNGAVTSGSVVRMDNTDLSAVINVGDKITTPVTTDTVDGAVSSGVKVVMDNNVAGKMAVGDRITSLSVSLANDANFAKEIITVAALNPDGDNVKEFSMSEAAAIADNAVFTFSSKVNRSTTTVTVVETSGTATDFTMSQAIQFLDNAPLTFSPRMNSSWPINNYANIIGEGMIVVPTTKVPGGISVSDTTGLTPTITRGLTTAQAGSIIFSSQQVVDIAGDTLKIGGYGESAIFDLHGYRVKFSDLAIALTPITTTTTAASAGGSSTSVVVASRNGILDDISTVSGIGINPAVVDPTVASGAGAVSGAGTIVLSAVQTLENGITLTFTGAGQKATITGNVEVLETGTADQTLSFDVERLLSIA